MKKRTCILIFLLALTCLLLCSCKGKSTVMTVLGTKIEGAEYAFYLNFNRLRLFDHQSGYTNAELMEARQASIMQIVTAETVRAKCRELGLEPSDAQKAELGREKAELMAALGGAKATKRHLKDSCLTLRTYDKLREHDLYYNLLFDFYRTTAAPKYTDESLREYYSDNYALVKYIRLSFFTDTGDRVSQKEEAKLRELAREVEQKARAGEDFDTLIYRYSDDRAVTGGSEGVIISRLAADGQNYLQAAFDLQDGQTSGIIEQTDGLYIVRRDRADDEFFAPNIDSIRLTACREEFENTLTEWASNATVTFKKRMEKINFSNLRKYVR